ncbi:MAG: type II toxin-antitoxin system RelE/ParE family toxin [Thiobacillus sp.]|nr:type II toxin-antitoxin system RelE/ParE family toxin [Thiobacillus sp.]MDP2977425.1 type II toxin-antitoxin system RelE/ParE family toxin [Thiobacillus sp.]
MTDFPLEARRESGFELWQVQRGLHPSDFKPMPSVGAGAFEIRIHVLGEWRVIYVAKFKNAVYVLHAFHKKTQKTRKEDIELAARRYKQIGAES